MNSVCFPTPSLGLGLREVEGLGDLGAIRRLTAGGRSGKRLV